MIIKYNKIDDYLKCSAGLFFLLLYPGFAFYNIVVAYGFFSPVFGGFFGVFTVFYLLSLFPVLFKLRVKFICEYRSVFFYIGLILFFFILVLFSSLLNYMFYSSEAVSLGFNQVIGSLILLVGAFFIGMNIELDEKLYKASLFFVVLSFLLLTFYIYNTGNAMFYPKSFAVNGVVDAVSTYQGFSRSAMVLCLLVMSMVKRQVNSIVFYIVSIFILFVLGSRSELVGFVFGAGIMLACKYRVSIYSFFKFIIMFLFFAILFVFTYDNFSDSRVFQLFDVSSASSWQARSLLQEIAVKQILEYPVFGYFGGHIVDGGSTGSYAHNILSVWAGFGFFTFLAYLLLCFIPLVSCITLVFKSNKRSAKFYFCLSLSAAVLLLVLFSKSIYWLVPGLVWGLYISVKKEINYEC